MLLIEDALRYSVPFVEAEARAALIQERPIVARMISPLLVWLIPIVARLAIEVFARWLRDRNLGSPEHAVILICGQTPPALAAKLDRYDA